MGYDLIWNLEFLMGIQEYLNLKKYLNKDGLK